VPAQEPCCPAADAKKPKPAMPADKFSEPDKHREYADRYLMYQLNHQLLTACSAKDIMLFISRVVPSSRMALPVKVPNIW